MEKWELARYVIDNKKVIDSIMFIDQQYEKIMNLDLNEIISSKLRLFFINICLIYDGFYKKSLMTHEEIKQHKNNNIYIEKAYYERDKYYAHKDDNYQKTEYENRQELILELKNMLRYCYKTCKAILPSKISLDYVPYDRNLYRFINNITPIKEKHFKEKMNSKTDIYHMGVKQFISFNDTEDYKYIPKTDIDQYAVKMEAGINWYEGLQNRQDAIIRINLLFGQDIWVKPPKNIHIVQRDFEKSILSLMN